jgi:hypothetical protein
MPNPSSLKLPKLDVAVVIIKNGKKILLIYNRKWGAFTLPMTNRRTLIDNRFPNAQPEEEDWGRAAARAAAEVLGLTFTPASAPKPVFELKNCKRSDADGRIKAYNFHVFVLAVTAGVKLAIGTNGEWLRPNDLGNREPISQTATEIINEFLLRGL